MFPGRHEPDKVRTRVHVTGLVQGVGFRPFVWREATERGLSGWVGNDAAGVVLEAEGSAGAVAALLLTAAGIYAARRSASVLAAFPTTAAAAAVLGIAWVYAAGT